MMVRVKKDEIDRVRRDNILIRNENHLLRTSLKNLKDNPYGDCNRALCDVVALCKKKDQEATKRGLDFSCSAACPPPPCCPPPCCSPPCCPPCPRRPPPPCCPSPPYCPPPCCPPSCYCIKCKSKKKKSQPCSSPKQKRPTCDSCGLSKIICICSPPCPKPRSPPCPKPRSPPCPRSPCAKRTSRARKKCPGSPTCPRPSCCPKKCPQSPPCPRPYPRVQSPPCPRSCAICCTGCCTCPRPRRSSCPPRRRYDDLSPQGYRNPFDPPPCPPPPRPSCIPKSKFKPACPLIKSSTCGCGGYTPSGWNRMSKCTCLICCPKPACLNFCKHNIDEDGTGVEANTCTSNSNNASLQIRQKNRIGEGCSGQGCGGYTPSGWNKVLNKQRLDCDDPCCIPPPCRCPCPCSYCCTCIPKPNGHVVYCCKNNSKLKGKCGRNRSNSRATSPSDKHYEQSEQSASETDRGEAAAQGDSASDKAEMVDTSGETEKHRPSSKILGELAFQLERRILDYVFGAEDSKRRRFYGYTVNNICDMMDKESKVCGEKDDIIKKTEMASRLKKILRGLAKHGYKINVHGDFAQKMINKYGLLQSPPDMCTVDSFGLNDANTISGLVSELACGPHESHNFNILLKSLQYISKCDGRPLFVW